GKDTLWQRLERHGEGVDIGYGGSAGRNDAGRGRGLLVVELVVRAADAIVGVYEYQLRNAHVRRPQRITRDAVQLDIEAIGSIGHTRVAEGHVVDIEDARR